MNENLKYWTADEVAECLDYEKHLPDEYDSWSLYRKLWNFLNESQNPTPIGGDGSDGTVEYPCGRQNLNNDDKANHWWNKLTDIEQSAINQAIIEQF